MLCVIYVPVKLIRNWISVLFEDLFFRKNNRQIRIVQSRLGPTAAPIICWQLMLTMKGKYLRVGTNSADLVKTAVNGSGSFDSGFGRLYRKKN